MSKKWLWLAIGVVGMVAAVGLVLLPGCPGPEVQEKARPTPAAQLAPAPAKAVSYQIVPGERGNKDYSIPGTKRYGRDITVPHETTDEEVNATLRSALKDFQWVHTDADVLKVRVFFEGATAMAHSHAIWGPGGEWAPRAKVARKSISFQSLAPRPPKPNTEDRFGLPLAKRREIFTDIVAAEDKAADEAWARYPDSLDK